MHDSFCRFEFNGRPSHLLAERAEGIYRLAYALFPKTTQARATCWGKTPYIHDYVKNVILTPKSSESGNVLDTMLGPRSDNYKQILDMEERPYHFYQWRKSGGFESKARSFTFYTSKNSPTAFLTKKKQRDTKKSGRSYTLGDHSHFS